jgi:beta-glucosidase
MARFLAVFGLAATAGVWGQTPTVEERVDQILGQMTLQEKLSYLGGLGMSIRPIPRLGLPEIVMSDGPLGVRSYGASTGYPAGIALAAAWNLDLAERMGVGLGRDCRARGVHI